MDIRFRYHHIGIPTEGTFEGETHLEELRVFVSDHESNPFGIQWMRFEKECPVPDLVRSVPHVAFEVDDLAAALRGRKVLIEPNSPSPGVLVAFVEEAGAPVELLQIARRRRSRGGKARTGGGASAP